MFEVGIKDIIDLIKPFTEEGAKRLFVKRNDAGDVLATAIKEKYAQVIREADTAVLAEKMAKRQATMDLRRQLNFENVLSLAIELAQETPREQHRDVEGDWFALWSQAVENVSDETVQQLWAQAFARQADGESRRLSLRALETLRQMERQDIANFRRVLDVFDTIGPIFVNSNDILEAIMAPVDLDALIDLKLIEQEEYFHSTVGAQGGFALYFTLPPEMSRDSFRLLRLSSRGRELHQTLPADLQVDYEHAGSFDLEDPLVVCSYLSKIAGAFDRRYDVALCVFDPKTQRPPPGGRKRTHRWNPEKKCWDRVRDLDFEVDPSVLDRLEQASEQS